MGWSAGKVDDVTACRAVQDGGYALPWQRYDNNTMAAICYYVLHLQQYSHRLNLLYFLSRFQENVKKCVRFVVSASVFREHF